MRLALALAFLVGAASAAAQDAPGAIVQAAGIDAMSWLCVSNAGDSPRTVSARQPVPSGASYQAPSSFQSLGARAGLGPAVTANRAWAPAMADPGTSIGVGLCHASFESEAALPPPAQPGLDAGTTFDTAIANADMLVSAGLTLAGYVVIPDTGLRRAVEQALGKRTHEPISPVDMAGLTDLAARRAGISDLSGLEFAVRLKHLDLDLNFISDVTPLAGLSSLEMLSLARNRIRDDAFSTLSRLTGLEVLSLAGNALDDLSPLAGLSRLRVLDLASTATKDVTPLQVLTELEGLYLGDNGIEDITALGGLNRLKWLLLGGNGIEDIAPLSALTDLRALSLGGNAVGDLSPLAGLSALETLVLTGNAIEDISALAGLVELQLLYLHHNAIADISPLAGLTGLRELALSYNAIKDISALAGLANLGRLWLRNNEIEDLSALAGLTELVLLGLEDNALVDISVLAGLTGLEVLRLGGNFVDDISVLAGLTKLEQLGLSRMSITDEDLAVLAGLTRLYVLDLGINNIADISVLAGLTGLRELDLQRNSIEDLSPLAELRQLFRLNLSGNAIRDLVPLTRLQSLVELDLSSNAVEDISRLVLNDGLDQGDIVVLSGNPLSPVSRNELIPDLRARGVEVHFDDDGQVSILDDGLRSAIESALGKEPGDAITATDMAELTELVAVSAGIEDLTGLEHAVNLVRLELDRNEVKDLSPLAELRDLQTLILVYNSVENVAPLSGLTALEVLDLGSNAVEDISALSGLTSLSVLSLWRNDVQNVAPLAELTALKVLDVGSNAVEDISALSELTALEVLSVRNNDVGDLSPLSQLQALKELYLEGNAIAEISPLAGLTELVDLRLGDNAVADISPLVDNAGLGDGDFVSLTGNPLSSESTSVHIPALEARDVEVEFDAEVSFSAQRDITTDTIGAASVFAADLDGDGDADVLSASIGDDKIAWYENLGGGEFSEQRVIVSDADAAISVHAADMDGDGDADVLSASREDDEIAWYENLGGGEFSEQRLVASGAINAVSVHAADMDGDGDADVLSASEFGGIAWHENQGGDTFTEHAIGTDIAANFAHAADMDGDGDADVLASMRRSVVWHENLGGGEFSEQRLIKVVNDVPGNVYAADLDADGDPDILTPSRNDNKVAWHENLGDGEFSAERVITTDAGGAIFAQAADLDGDGDLDVLSASEVDDKVAWYENQGSGEFSAQRVIVSDVSSAQAVYPADLDGDGDMDVLSASLHGNSIAWYENLANHGDDHDNTVGAAATFATSLPAFLHGTLESGGDRDVFRFATGTGTLRMYSRGPTDTFGSLIDANGAILAQNDDQEDGNLNFRIDVEVNAGKHYVEIRGYNDETTGPYTLSIVFEAHSAPVFDSEVPPDQSYTTGSAIVELTLPTASGGSGAFQYSLTPVVPGLSFDPNTRRLSGAPTAAGDYRMTYSATDANGDGVSWTFTISVVAAGFSAERVITTNAATANSVHAVDLDGDGDVDVLSASYSDDLIAWYENLGGGTFSPQRAITTDADGAGSVHTADLDGDGDLDVLSTSGVDDVIAWYETQSGGVFSDRRIITTFSGTPDFVHAADLDGDGDTDVLAGDDNEIDWYENEGDGRFSSGRVVRTGARGSTSAHAVDLDGDGDGDVLSASFNDEIAWHENMGDGEFSAQRTIATAAGWDWSVHAADLDGDGDPDVLATSSGPVVESAHWRMVWHENLGGGQFSAQRVITDDAGAQMVASADLDGDGDLDVLAAFYYDDRVAWYENLGGGAFSEQRAIAANARGAPISVYPADLDSDGDADVLAAWQDDGKVAWYENLANHGDDHGDAPASATLATVLPAFLHGTLESGGDRDVFRFATGAGTLRVRSNGPTDTYGWLLDHNGDFLAGDDSPGNFQFETQVDAGVHYVETFGADQATTGPYTLSIEFVDASQPARLVDEFPDSRLVQIYNDNVVIMHVGEDVGSAHIFDDSLPLEDYAMDFYRWFEDEFDYLLFYSNVPVAQPDSFNFPYYGVYDFVMNDTLGLGLSTFRNSSYGSAGRLRGVIHIPFSDDIGPLVHELLHAWANFAVPTTHRSHWGFSSANGRLGGFDIDTLVDLGNGRWSAGSGGDNYFGEVGGAGPYSPIELYFAGLAVPEEVPELWVAEDGAWELDENGRRVLTDSGAVFTAQNVRTWSIDDIVAEHGARSPREARRNQRLAVILLIDARNSPRALDLHTLSERMTRFGLQGGVGDTSYNYYEAALGRATLSLDGLSALRKSVPAEPANLPASFGIPPPPHLTTFEELYGPFASPAPANGSRGARNTLITGGELNRTGSE